MTDLSAEYKALAEYRPVNKVRFVTPDHVGITGWLTRSRPGPASARGRSTERLPIDAFDSPKSRPCLGAAT